MCEMCRTQRFENSVFPKRRVQYVYIYLLGDDGNI
jgi:hypothetical protein